MLSIFNKLIKDNILLIFLVIFILFISTNGKSETVHINYTDTNMYNNMKSELEDMGFTVTGTNSGTVTLSDFTSKDLHINVAGSSNCGNNCKTAYESYIGAGGTVIIAGNGDHDGNRTGNIEQLIESKLSVGTITMHTGEASYTSWWQGNRFSGAATTGYTAVRNLFTMNSGGTSLGNNHSGGTGLHTWAEYSYGSNGGKLVVTFDQIQFNQSNSTWSTRTWAGIEQQLEEMGILSTTVNITPTTTQSSTITSDKAQTGNGVKMNVDGDGNTINIEQTGEDNFIIGTNWSSDSAITGNNNTVNIDQGNVTTSGTSGNNGIALDITGNTNTLNISQGDYGTDTGDHRIWLDIDGSTNTTNLSQRNDGTATTEHFMSLDLDSSQNIINLQQLNDGDKILFLDINNNNNTVDINQSGTGEHYLDLSLDTGSYAHDVDISQTGSGDHAARIELDGYSTDFDLSQQGSTDQDYNVDMTCGVIAGCTLSTTQGN
jgi:hypothetical protein